MVYQGGAGGGLREQAEEEGAGCGRRLTTRGGVREQAKEEERLSAQGSRQAAERASTAANDDSQLPHSERLV